MCDLSCACSAVTLALLWSRTPLPLVSLVVTSLVVTAGRGDLIGCLSNCIQRHLEIKTELRGSRTNSHLQIVLAIEGCGFWVLDHFRKILKLRLPICANSSSSYLALPSTLYLLSCGPLSQPIGISSSKLEILLLGKDQMQL